MAHVTVGLNPAMDYNQGWYKITCILKEGTITAGSGVYTQNGELIAPNVTIATALSQGDFVSISTDTANTASATGGKPVVTTTAAGANFGVIASEPMWVVVPSSTQATWATMLAGNYYRIATVWCDCTGMFDAPTVEAATGTAITPGDAIIWDNSDNGWVQAISGGFAVADGKVWNNTADDQGANGYISYPIALHYSASDTGRVLAAKNLIPWTTQA